jgi:hypothetical protein
MACGELRVCEFDGMCCDAWDMPTLSRPRRQSLKTTRPLPQSDAATLRDQLPFTLHSCAGVAVDLAIQRDLFKLRCSPLHDSLLIRKLFQPDSAEDILCVETITGIHPRRQKVIRAVPGSAVVAGVANTEYVRIGEVLC